MGMTLMSENYQLLLMLGAVNSLMDEAKKQNEYVDAINEQLRFCFNGIFTLKKVILGG